MEAKVQMKRLGMLIAIESGYGPDADTQVALLAERLKQNGYAVVRLDFPRRERGSSYFVTQYQDAEYGSPQDVGPYTGSILYALDRFDSAGEIKKALNEGKIVLVRCYTADSMARQGMLLPHAEQRRGYFIWLDNLESHMLQVPRADKTLVIRRPLEALEEADFEQTSIRPDDYRLQLDVYDDLTQLFPKDFTRIDMVRSSKVMNQDELSNHIWHSIEPILPPKSVLTTDAEKPANNKQTFRVSVPKQLPQALATLYIDTLDHIIRTYERLVATSDELGKENAIDILQAVLPISAFIHKPPAIPTLTAGGSIKDLADRYLSDTYPDVSERLRLITSSPRNELDLVPDMLYESSDLSAHELLTEVGTWSYQQKTDVFEAYIQDTVAGRTKGAALEALRYDWDILSDYATFRAFTELRMGRATRSQPLTPRYGYEVPDLIEQIDEVERFEECFDMSLELFSALQAHGFNEIAPLVTLRGHKMRWKVSLNGLEILKLIQRSEKGINTTPLQKVLSEITSCTLGIHPLISVATDKSTSATPRE